MKYRIITNNKVYRIQQKVWWWPFWMVVEEYHDGWSGGWTEPMEFSSWDEAIRTLRSWVTDEHTKTTPKWQIVSEEFPC